MHKSKLPSSTFFSLSRLYSILIFALIIIFVYLISPFRFPSSFSPVFADVTKLRQSKFFTFANLSDRVRFSEIQGILYVPPVDQSAHFASINRQAVRGNHRHVGNENSITGEVLTLLHGHFLIRIGDGETNEYEDHQFDVSKIGMIGLEFSADKCHAVKNIGEQTNWFASYYIRSKSSIKPPPIDREGCRKILLS